MPASSDSKEPWQKRSTICEPHARRGCGALAGRNKQMSGRSLRAGRSPFPRSAAAPFEWWNRVAAAHRPALFERQPPWRRRGSTALSSRRARVPIPGNLATCCNATLCSIKSALCQAFFTVGGPCARAFREAKWRMLSGNATKFFGWAQSTEPSRSANDLNVSEAARFRRESQPADVGVTGRGRRLSGRGDRAAPLTGIQGAPTVPGAMPAGIGEKSAGEMTPARGWTPGESPRR